MCIGNFLSLSPRESRGAMEGVGAVAPAVTILWTPHLKLRGRYNGIHSRIHIRIDLDSCEARDAVYEWFVHHSTLCAGLSVCSVPLSSLPRQN